MNKKIKVIDLIDKIYHKNNIPKRIKYKYKIWLYDNVEERYCLEGSFVTLSFETDRLTDEVEILEYNTEDIEELDRSLKFDDLIAPYGKNEDMMWTEIIKQHNKIDEIIRYVKRKDKNK